MNFLIICSFYPPDSAISAVRPYMFAKYLSKMGHKVTVLRSGKFDSKPDNQFKDNNAVEVISFLGEDCDAERFSRGDYIVSGSGKASAESPSKALNCIKSIYHFINEPFFARSRIKKAKEKFVLQKMAIDSMHQDFDIVISTYSEIENVFAGEYAAKHFNAKWIMDFRDSIVDHIHSSRYIWNMYARKWQKHAICEADLCTTVSEGLTEEINAFDRKAHVETLYNGYDEEEQSTACEIAGGKLTICYTGMIYGLRLNALTYLVKAIRKLVDDKSISKEDIVFAYAGSNSNSVRHLFSEYSLSEMVEDHGMVSRTEALTIQNRADAFLVLSWNTKTTKGILTGKFYEGIRAGKPIISIVDGDVPNSELKYLNQQYNYGFCYEPCDEKTNIADLAKYILCLCREKATLGKIQYKQSVKLEYAFRYDKIVQKLNDLASQLCKEENRAI